MVPCSLLRVGAAALVAGLTILPLDSASAQSSSRRMPVFIPIPLPVLGGTTHPEALDLDVRIEERVAAVHATQRFVNHGAATLEGDYLFALPPGVAVTDLVFEVDGREYAGEILEADAARRHYESVVARQKDPALLEYAGHNLFRARVFPIPPGTSRSLTLSYHAVLPADGGLAEFRFPLRSGWLVPAGAAGETRFDPPPRGAAAATMEVSLSLSVEEASQIGAVYSPSHPVEVDRIDERRVDVAFDNTGAGAEADFVLFYEMDPGEMGIATFVQAHSGDDDAYLLLLASPGHDLAPAKRGPLSVLFVLDTSGSMAGGKLDEAREALLMALEGLDERDRFGIVAFSSGVDPFTRDLVPADREHLRAARRFLEDLRPQGGTNIAGALQEAFRMSRAASSMVFFLTDGLPTVGETQLDRILAGLESAGGSRHDLHVFSVGVGYDVNTLLLGRLAERFRGAVEYVTPGESLEEKVARLLRKTMTPILTDVRVEIDGGRLRDAYPGEVPFLFAGEQISVAGRIENAQERMTLRLTARRPDGRELVLTRRLHPREGSGGDFVERLWASRKVGYLLDEIRLHGDRDELVREVVALATEYGIVTEYTSFLADPEMLARVPAEADLSQSMRDAMPALRAESGEGAVLGGRALAAQKASMYVPAAPRSDAMELGLPQSEPAVSPVRRAASRTFYLREGIWTEEGWSDGGGVPLRLRAFGSGYFRLVREWPAAAEALALGERVRIMAGKIAIEIAPEGAEDLDAAAWERVRRVIR